MALELPYGIKILSTESVDYWYGPYSTLAAAKSAVPSGVRANRTVKVGNAEYWWRNGITDDDLIPKSNTNPNSGYSQKIIANLAATFSIELTGSQGVDGFTVKPTDLVLVCNQTASGSGGTANPEANGLYYPNLSGSWTRADIDIENVGFVQVMSGSSQIESLWRQYASTPTITLEVTPILYEKLSFDGNQMIKKKAFSGELYLGTGLTNGGTVDNLFGMAEFDSGIYRRLQMRNENYGDNIYTQLELVAFYARLSYNNLTSYVYVDAVQASMVAQSINIGLQNGNISRIFHNGLDGWVIEDRKTEDGDYCSLQLSASSAVFICSGSLNAGIQYFEKGYETTDTSLTSRAWVTASISASYEGTFASASVYTDEQVALVYNEVNNQYTYFDDLMTSSSMTPIIVISASYTLTNSDFPIYAYRGMILVSTGSAINITIPNNTSIFPMGATIDVFTSGSNLVTILSQSNTVSVRSLNARVKSNGQYSNITMKKVRNNEWFLSGDLSV